MQEDTHYLYYHCIVESGYTTPISSISQQHKEDGQDPVYHYAQNEPSSTDFSFTTLLKFDQSSTERSGPKFPRFNSQYLVSNELNQGSEYLQPYTIRAETMLNEQRPEEIFPTTLSPTRDAKETHRIYDFGTYPDIFSTINCALQQLNIVVASNQYNTQESLIRTAIDMLTLVIFIVLLRRWIQFDVLGSASGGASDIFLDNGGTHGAARFRRRTRTQQIPRLRWVYPNENCNENSDTSSSSLLSSSSRRSCHIHQSERSSSSSSSTSYSFGDENNFEGDTLEISISDEISSFVTSSSFSLTEEDDKTDVGDNGSDGDCSSISGNVDEKFGVTIDNERIIPCQSSDKISPTPNNTDKEKYLCGGNSFSNIKSKSNISKEKIDAISSGSSYDDENEEDYAISEFSWFAEHYPDWTPIYNSSQQMSKSNKKDRRFHAFEHTIK